MYKLEDKKSGVPTYIAMSGEKIATDNIKEDFAYVICDKGTFIKRDNFLYSGFFKVESKNLGTIEEAINVKIDFRIPWNLFESIEGFFESVYEKYKSEVAILLYYNKDKKVWAYGVPQQTVSGASVEYDIKKGCSFILETNLGEELDKLPEGFAMVGSIHSHASMSAFHSGTDDKDEFGFDGIHITIGKLNDRNHEYACRMMFGKTDIKKNLEDVVCCPTKAVLFPKNIIAKVAETAKSYVRTEYGHWTSQGWNAGKPFQEELPIKYSHSGSNVYYGQERKKSTPLEDYVYANGFVINKNDGMNQ